MHHAPSSNSTLSVSSRKGQCAPATHSLAPFSPQSPQPVLNNRHTCLLASTRHPKPECFIHLPPGPMTSPSACTSSRCTTRRLWCRRLKCLQEQQQQRQLLPMCTDPFQRTPFGPASPSPAPAQPGSRHPGMACHVPRGRTAAHCTALARRQQRPPYPCLPNASLDSRNHGSLLPCRILAPPTHPVRGSKDPLHITLARGPAVPARPLAPDPQKCFQLPRGYAVDPRPLAPLDRRCGVHR